MLCSGAIIHDQIAGAFDIHCAHEETFVSSVVGDYGVIQIEIDWRGSATERTWLILVDIDHDCPSRAGALVAAEGGIRDLKLIVQREDRATRASAV